MRAGEIFSCHNAVRSSVCLLLVAALCLVMIPAATRSPASAGALGPGKATFELASIFPRQVISPRTGGTVTWFPLDVRNINGGGSLKTVRASAVCDQPGFTVKLIGSYYKPDGPDGVASGWVGVCASPSVPDGTDCWIKVTGKRGSELHRVWLKVTALASKPLLERSSGDMLFGKGYKEPETRVFVGAPLQWNFNASNLGAAEDTYKLGYTADFPCDVKFSSPGGEAASVNVRGLTRNYLYPANVSVTAEVTPKATLPKNSPGTVNITLGPGAYSGETSTVSLKVVDPGMLYCANDLDGPRPSAHQLMGGESTSFVFHVTNLESAPIDVGLSFSGGAPGWEVGLDTAAMSDIEPTETRQAVLSVKAPVGAPPGERLELAVSAASSSGDGETVRVAAEVTATRNIYFWSVDSMEPEYMYLNRSGTGPGSEGDWLMPNHHDFLSQAANFTDARSFLPTATDMNHTNALAGTYTGTSGVYLVGGTVRGFTEHDEPMNALNSMDLMKYGPEGKPIERIYEVAERETGGKSVTGFWSNKNWLTELECQRTVEIKGHSESWPYFYPPPRKYVAGDPVTDSDPWDPMSGPFSMDLYSDVTREIIIPTLLGQFNFLLGFGFFTIPVSLVFGLGPGSHSEDRHLARSVFRSIAEEDPDVAYINVADLDNTGHFTGSSWNPEEWDTRGTETATDDINKYSPWMKRDECLDIAREEDVLFGEFLDLLKARGVYDNSIIVVLSDHGMENVKDQDNGYELLDLRKILSRHGFVYNEDYREAGGAGSVIWCADPAKTAQIEQVLEQYVVDDPELGEVRPMVVINRQEMKDGADFGEMGTVLPGELYSEYWINNPGGPEGHIWADLFVFPQYRYNICTHGQVLAGGFNPVGITLGNIPDTVQMGFPSFHGGLSTGRIPLVFKAPMGYPGYAPGTESAKPVRIGDLAPTVYQIMGWPAPDCVDGTPL